MQFTTVPDKLNFAKAAAKSEILSQSNPANFSVPLQPFTQMVLDLRKEVVFDEGFSPLSTDLNLFKLCLYSSLIKQVFSDN